MWSLFLWLDSERLQVLSASQTLPPLFSLLTQLCDGFLSPLPNPNHLAKCLESKQVYYSWRKLFVSSPIHLDGSCPAVTGTLFIGVQNFLSQPPEPCDYRKSRAYGVCKGSTKAFTFSNSARHICKHILIPGTTVTSFWHKKQSCVEIYLVTQNHKQQTCLSRVWESHLCPSHVYNSSTDWLLSFVADAVLVK